MAQQTETPTEYTMGYSDEFTQLLEWRRVEDHAMHLLPHIESGMRVLDFGCGPGTITVGLAEAAYPGEVHGIDMEESQIELAKLAAADGGHDNITLHVGDVCEMPFEDNYFDIAHCHTVLMHVPDTQRALAEVKRVLKPGGIISARELITSSCFVEPEGETTPEAWRTFSKLLMANGGHPEMGRQLKSKMIEAGFSDIYGTGSFDYFSSEKEVAFLHKFVSDWFFMPRVVQAAIQFGLATQSQFDQWRIDMDELKDAPGAVGGLAFGEVIAQKPR